MSDETPHLTIKELSERSRRSISTIQRLKKAGHIPFYQPGGPNTLVTFPPDAIERACAATAGNQPVPPIPLSPKKLSGPQPAWLKSQSQTK